MERVNRILRHNKYREAQEEIKAQEESRIYCRHDLSHQMDVARISYILYLEQRDKREEPFSAKEILYAAALLHDLGRAASYALESSHPESGAGLAGEILPDCGFCGEEVARIQQLIRDHGRNKEEIFGKADRLSRSCFACEARKECFWPAGELNKGIAY